jgi:hypothetical protein
MAQPQPQASWPRPDPFKAHWSEVLECLEARPDQTALELLLEFHVYCPERYTLRQLATMQRRLRVWRREAVKRLICDSKEVTQDVAAEQW